MDKEKFDFFDMVLFIMESCADGEENAMEDIFKGEVSTSSIIFCLTFKVSEARFYLKMIYMDIAQFLLSLSCEDDRKYYLNEAIERANKKMLKNS